MMFKRLRKLLLSVPVVTAVGLAALYLLLGFLVLPAALKWQLEKQVGEQLEHRLEIGELRFDPLKFQLELRDLSLADAQKRPMTSFKRLFVEFELRSIVDGAWTFAEATLDAPQFHLSLDKNGRHNFADLLRRLLGEPRKPAGVLPRILLRRLTVNDGKLDIRDAALSESLLARIEPLQLTVEKLSTWNDELASYRLSARSASGESLEVHGEVGLDPLQARGRLAVKDLKLVTLARSLSRQLALGAVSGELDLGLAFELRDGNEMLARINEMEMQARQLSVSAPTQAEPLLALQSLSLRQGKMDLGKRQIEVAELQANAGQIGARIDAQGQLDWSALLRQGPSSEPQKSGAVAAPAPVSVAKPWTVSLGSVAVGEVALRYADAQHGRQVETLLEQLQMSAALQSTQAGPRLLLGKASLQAKASVIDLDSERLALPATRIAAEQITLQSGKAQALAVQSLELELAQGFDAKQGDASLRAAALQGKFAALALHATETGPQLRLEATSLEMKGLETRGPGTETTSAMATLAQLNLAGRQWNLRQSAGQTHVALDGVDAQLLDLKASSGSQRMELQGAGLSAVQGTLEFDAAGAAGLRLRSEKPSVTLTGLKAQSDRDRIALDRLSLGGALLVLASQAKDIEMNLEKFQSRSGIGLLQQGVRSLSLGPAQLDGEALSMRQSVGLTRLNAKTVQLGLSALQAKQGAAELGRIKSLNLSAGTMALTLPEGPVELEAGGIEGAFDEAVLLDAQARTELLRLKRLVLAGGRLNLRQRSLSADRLQWAGGRAGLSLDAEGRWNWSQALAPSNAKAEAAPAAASAVTPWRVALKQVDLSDVEIDHEDRRATPALKIGLRSVQASAQDVDTAAEKPMSLQLRAGLASGGSIAAEGSVHANSGAADLQIKAQGLALDPLQSYLSRFADLRLASGKLSSEGRLRYAQGARAGAQLSYQGKLALDQLLLEEMEPKRPFFAADSIASDDLRLSLQPDRLDIGELRVERPVGRLIIAADQTVNLTDVLRKPQATPKSVPSAPAVSASDEQFALNIARTRIRGGRLEFADLSLRPQFSTRMHELQGVVTGLSNAPGRRTGLQLDARVDSYGSAKIRGQLDLSSPRSETEIAMEFRNLEMISLSPYVAKFAGYEIKSGRLALDLLYRVKDSKLLGENKIVLHQLELGQKVDSPNALDLPIELALAVLKDSKGVIDIGLPVSGDLSDPKFAYGAVIGQAIGNLLGGIVTAPFRALAALFGAADSDLERIEFEPGWARVEPPQRQKLDAIARALLDRPQLKLVVPPSYAPEPDRAALKSLAVRRDLLQRMGVQLAPDEDPGPIDAADPKTQQALEAAFTQRYAPQVLALLKSRAVEQGGVPAPLASAPAVPAAGASAAVAAPAIVQPSAAAVAPAPFSARVPPPSFYQGLLERLMSEQEVGEAALVELAVRRGEAVLREFTNSAPAAATRIVLGKTGVADAGDGKRVSLRLQLEAAP